MNVELLGGAALADAIPRLSNYALREPVSHPAKNPLWLYVLKDGLGHVPFALEATEAGQTVGYLPLAFVRSTLFGRFLVSLPYLNTAGLIADSEAARSALLDRAVTLSYELKARHLELRHEEPVGDERLNGTRDTKVHMRLALPSFPGPLWESLQAKVRNQVRKGEKNGLKLVWGTWDVLDDFYDVFATNMRDLGTPVYSRNLFAAMLRYFPKGAEICIVKLADRPIAGAIIIHGQGITEVPSASSLREFNNLNANMLMYWNLIDRAIQREQAVFDFGRATRGGNTYKFKKQWGAVEGPAVWQYHLHGKVADLRTDNPRYARFIKLWQRLPVPVTRVIGPPIVRGIP